MSVEGHQCIKLRKKPLLKWSLNLRPIRANCNIHQIMTHSYWLMVTLIARNKSRLMAQSVPIPPRYRRSSSWTSGRAWWWISIPQPKSLSWPLKTRLMTLTRLQWILRLLEMHQHHEASLTTREGSKVGYPKWTSSPSWMPTSSKLRSFKTLAEACWSRRSSSQWTRSHE